MRPLNCASCGHANRDSARFCAVCGDGLLPSCGSCGAAIEAGAQFCDACGAPVAASREPPSGARRVVSVVFADLAGSTELQESLDAESVRRVMERFYEAMRSVVQSHGGQVAKFIGEAMREWGSGKLMSLFAPSAEGALLRQGMAAFERSAASPRMAHALFDMANEIDVRDLLPAIGVPTLILHRDHEIMPVEHSRYLASHIPGAKLAVLPGVDHIPFFGDVDRYVGEIEAFLRSPLAEQLPERVLTTVLFTDIIASTERASELGDGRWRELLEEHYSLVRELLERFRGREVTTTGDGFLASFDGPARAIRCGQALIERLAHSDIPIRAGIHTGECETIGEDLAGIAVHIGARIAALGASGELLVSSTVKDLVVGSGISFEHHGEHALKGVSDPWMVFRVLGDEDTDRAARTPVADDRELTVRDRALLTLTRRNPRLAHPFLRRGA